MRYAIFTDIHANLEALEAVLAKIDELAQEEPIDQIWFLGDLVGYGPNPNECIEKLRERADLIIAGNHDWAVVGKLDLEDFSAAARASAEWTAQQLTEEHREFLYELPERINREDCVLVHGSPFGPIWEYLTSEVLAERSFEYFSPRFCFVGHTHVPVIFQQPFDLSKAPTTPLNEAGQQYEESDEVPEDDDTEQLVAVHPSQFAGQTAQPVEQERGEAESLQSVVADAADMIAEVQQMQADDPPEHVIAQMEAEESSSFTGEDEIPHEVSEQGQETTDKDTDHVEVEVDSQNATEQAAASATTSENTIQEAEGRLNEEIDELLTLLGLSQSMVSISNEMLVPPEGSWSAPEHYRAIINPGGVGQPRDGDPRASFMIYDTERGFTFYRVPYPFEQTQEKIIQSGLPPYLAKRLEFGR